MKKDCQTRDDGQKQREKRKKKGEKESMQHQQCGEEKDREQWKAKNYD